LLLPVEETGPKLKMRIVITAFAVALLTVPAHAQGPRMDLSQNNCAG